MFVFICCIMYTFFQKIVVHRVRLGSIVGRIPMGGYRIFNFSLLPLQVETKVTVMPVSRVFHEIV